MYPCWCESDARLTRVPDSYSTLTATQIYERIESCSENGFDKEDPLLRLLMCVAVDGLQIWKEFEHYKEQIDITDPTELAKFDMEFRRFIRRREMIEYDEDFDDDTCSSGKTISNQDIEINVNISLDSTFEREIERDDDDGSVNFNGNGNPESYINTDPDLTRGSNISFDFSLFSLKSGKKIPELYEEDSIEVVMNKEKEPNSFFNSNEDSNSYSSDEISQSQLAPPSEYTILKFLGKGAEGRVYLGVNTNTHNLVALKQYEAESHEGNALLQILAKEVRTLMSLDHPNIVQHYALHAPLRSCEVFFT